MSTQPEKLYRIKCSTNRYPWGKQGSNSISARLCQKQPGWDGEGPQTDFKIDESESYAEMWMGTYPVLPSYVATTGEDLQDVLDRHPKELIGEQVMNKFGHSKLPYLPKVLSIAKALPLQVHPNKDLASKLHQKDPTNFGDDNHKPEIALALSEFEAFCGFKPSDNIAHLIQLEPLKQFLPSGVSPDEFQNDHLRTIVRNILTAPDATIKQVYDDLTSIPSEHYSRENAHIPRLAPRLAAQYAATDPGVLVALVLMNYLHLQAGESIYIPADGIHAYLSGDIIECMARSDNVLNTGFCPRPSRDTVDLFCQTLSFSPQSPEQCMLRPRGYGKGAEGKTRVYAPPMSEFDLLETRLGKEEREVLQAINGPSMLIATQGGAQLRVGGKMEKLNEGAVFFVAQGTEIEVEAGAEGLVMHTAIVE